MERRSVEQGIGEKRAAASPKAHECLANLAQGTVWKILGQEEVKPHEVRDDLFELPNVDVGATSALQPALFKQLR